MFPEFIYFVVTRIKCCFVPFLRDYNEFLDDLEEDAVYRQNVNIYRDLSKPVIPVDINDIAENGPCITLEEMIDELSIQDVEMTHV